MGIELVDESFVYTPLVSNDRAILYRSLHIKIISIAMPAQQKRCAARDHVQPPLVLLSVSLY